MGWQVRSSAEEVRAEVTIVREVVVWVDWRVLSWEEESRAVEVEVIAAGLLDLLELWQVVYLVGVRSKIIRSRVRVEEVNNNNNNNMEAVG